MAIFFLVAKIDGLDNNNNEIMVLFLNDFPLFPPPIKLPPSSPLQLSTNQPTIEEFIMMMNVKLNIEFFHSFFLRNQTFFFSLQNSIEKLSNSIFVCLFVGNLIWNIVNKSPCICCCWSISFSIDKLFGQWKQTNRKKLNQTNDENR